MPRNWQAAVDRLSNVGKLVHLAMRMDAFDVTQVRGELVRHLRAAYNDELGIQAARVGCADRQGRLTTGPILSALGEEAAADAESIVNTYNYDLAIAIAHIRTETPTANRYVYAHRLRQWHEARSAWKVPQIAQMTEQKARARAQQDFAEQNGRRTGIARMQPRTAACPICQGWIARGDVPVRVALNNPPPYHVNCPHLWDIDTGRVSRDECPDLWMGE